jgi:hypothetical protein
MVSSPIGKWGVKALLYLIDTGVEQIASESYNTGLPEEGNIGATL